MMRWVRPDEIKTHADLALFPIGDHELGIIAESMRAEGFDAAQPIVVWSETGYVVDGHTRLAAAKRAPLDSVAIYEQSFDGWDEALEYAIARQRDRRNLSREQFRSYVAHVVRASDHLKQRGGDHTSDRAKASIDAFAGKSANGLAEKIGVSQPTVERVRAVLQDGDEETKERMMTGELSPNAAYQQVRQAERMRVDSAPLPPSIPASNDSAATKPRPSFSIAQWTEMSGNERFNAISAGIKTDSALNKQETDNIEWAKWSWNPITGCLHDCPYCYARDIANRFYTQKFAPTFLPWRLGAPSQQRVPAQAETELGYRNIFTCSMADLFGKWVPAEWIEAVLDVVRQNSQWNFLFLTKFPNRLAEFEYPDNAWLGTSVDCQARVKNAERSFAKVRGGVKWLSIEPMLENIRFTSLDMFNWVVIGGASASTQTPAWIPPRRWVLDLESQAREADCMIYEKTNLGIQGPSRFREYPGWQREAQTLPDALAYLPSIEQGK